MADRKIAPAESAEPAEWVAEALTAFAQNVGSVIPAKFEAYVRIFHTVHMHEGGTYRRTTWAEAAEQLGLTFHPEIQLPGVSAQHPILSHEEGSLDLDREQRAVLTDVLARHTSAPDHCYFAVWDGWAGLESRFPDAPRFEIPERPMLLFEGPLEAVSTSYSEDVDDNGPNLWWPADRAWCVATEIDFSWTYVGGTESLIRELLGERRLEIVRAEITHGVTNTSDKINGPVDQ